MKQANAKQKQWMSDIAEYINEYGLGGLYEGYEGSANFQLHHVLGRSAKQNKVPIGHEFVIPVPFELHDVMSNHPENVTHRKKAFVERYGTQRGLFDHLVYLMKENDYDTPSDEVRAAIESTSA